jgi:hypothetical protein
VLGKFLELGGSFPTLMQSQERLPTQIDRE